MASRLLLPSHVYVGRDSIKHACLDLANRQTILHQHVMVVTDAGSCDRARIFSKELEAKDVRYTLIEPKCTNELSKVMQELHPDVCIAVGNDAVFGRCKNAYRSPRIFYVPDSFSIDLHQHHHLPDAFVLHPLFSEHVMKPELVFGSLAGLQMDVECLLANDRNSYVQMIGLESISMFFEYLERARRLGTKDEQAMTMLMYALSLTRVMVSNSSHGMCMLMTQAVWAMFPDTFYFDRVYVALSLHILRDIFVSEKSPVIHHIENKLRINNSSTSILKLIEYMVDTCGCKRHKISDSYIEQKQNILTDEEFVSNIPHMIEWVANKKQQSITSSRIAEIYFKAWA